MFYNFIRTGIFPGRQLPEPEWVVEAARAAGFAVERIHPLQLHCARTLDCCLAARQRRHADAVRIDAQDAQETYETYFRKGYIDVMWFTLVQQPARA